MMSVMECFGDLSRYIHSLARAYGRGRKHRRVGLHHRENLASSLPPVKYWSSAFIPEVANLRRYGTTALTRRSYFVPVKSEVLLLYAGFFNKIPVECIRREKAIEASKDRRSPAHEDSHPKKRILLVFTKTCLYKFVHRDTSSCTTERIKASDIISLLFIFDYWLLASGGQVIATVEHLIHQEVATTLLFEISFFLSRFLFSQPDSLERYSRFKNANLSFFVSSRNVWENSGFTK
jgi:hypothetical protein